MLHFWLRLPRVKPSTRAFWYSLRGEPSQATASALPWRVHAYEHAPPCARHCRESVVVVLEGEAVAKEQGVCYGRRGRDSPKFWGGGGGQPDRDHAGGEGGDPSEATAHSSGNDAVHGIYRHSRSKCDDNVHEALSVTQSSREAWARARASAVSDSCELSALTLHA